MVFLFPNLPTELSFMIEDYVLLFYKEIHKQKLAKVMDEYKVTNRIHITMPKWESSETPDLTMPKNIPHQNNAFIQVKFTSKPCFHSGTYDWHYCFKK